MSILVLAATYPVKLMQTRPRKPMRHLGKIIIALACLNAVSTAVAADSPTLQSEQKLIGAWQEGMTPKIAQFTREQRARVKSVLGAVVAYRADHTFELYPRCGVHRDDLRKAGLQSIKGTWKLSGADKLALMVNFKGKEVKTELRLLWQDGQMVLLNEDGSVSEKAGKYEGPLPPAC